MPFLFLLCFCALAVFFCLLMCILDQNFQQVKTRDYYEKETISQIFLWSCIREVIQRQSKKWTHHIHKCMCKYCLVVFQSVLFWSVSHCTLISPPGLKSERKHSWPEFHAKRHCCRKDLGLWDPVVSTSFFFQALRQCRGCQARFGDDLWFFPSLTSSITYCWL